MHSLSEGIVGTNPIGRIAISGASGLVGRELSRALVDAGYTVIPLVRPDSKRASGDATLSWDPLHGIEDLESVPPFDSVVHLAGRSIGEKRWKAAEKDVIRSSRVDATAILAQQLAACANPPKVFVSASATGIYGECGADEIDESYPIADSGDFLGSVAADWEAACKPLNDSGLTRVVHPRLGVVMSPSGGALGKVLPLFRWFLGGRLGSGTQYWNWISLHDCVRAIVWMLENKTAVGAYNVVAPNPITNRQFTEAVARAVGRPVSLPVRAFMLRLAMGEMADALLLRSCRAVPARLLEAGFSFRDTTLDRALAACMH